MVEYAVKYPSIAKPVKAVTTDTWARFAKIEKLQPEMMLLEVLKTRKQQQAGFRSFARYPDNISLDDPKTVKDVIGGIAVGQWAVLKEIYDRRPGILISELLVKGRKLVPEALAKREPVRSAPRVGRSLANHPAGIA